VANDFGVFKRPLPCELLVADETSSGVSANNDKDLTDRLIVGDNSGLLPCGLANHCPAPVWREFSSGIENFENRILVGFFHQATHAHMRNVVLCHLGVRHFGAAIQYHLLPIRGEFTSYCQGA